MRPCDWSSARADRPQTDRQTYTHTHTHTKSRSLPLFYISQIPCFSFYPSLVWITACRSLSPFASPPSSPEQGWVGWVRRRPSVSFLPGPVSSDSSSNFRPDPTVGACSLTGWPKAPLLLTSDSLSVSHCRT